MRTESSVTYTYNTNQPAVPSVASPTSDRCGNNLWRNE